ncbi:MAG: succinate dehydrogenase/fumarate reductase iron-sulfur subunit, partial [Ignavibacteria bacterium]|nr:succinate dehydrogenase/fumarate reductase iron-sulfur subunit [Ignavibacteria bacterium]
MNFTLKVWRQHDRRSEGKFVEYTATDISPDMSFLEMMDAVNLKLAERGEDTIAFDHDCREGICGSCGMFINGRAHGPARGVATCQLYMRVFKDGETIVVEPWRAKPFPVIKDLVVDRSGFDRVIQAGGYVSVDTGGVPDGNAIPIPKVTADEAFDAAACIGCGACVAA